MLQKYLKMKKKGFWVQQKYRRMRKNTLLQL